MKKATNSSTIKMLSFLFVIIGLAIVIINGINAWQTYQFKQKAKPANGIVIATPFGKFHPAVKFTTDKGQPISYTQNGWHEGYEIGDEIKLLYLEEQPRAAKVDSFIGLWGGHILFAVMGFVFCILGAIKYKNPKSKLVHSNLE